MKVRVDGVGVGDPFKELDDFEKVQAVVEKVRRTPIVQSITSKEKDGQVTYNGHVVRANDVDTLRNFVSDVVDDMSLLNFTGKVYSGDQAVFQDDFAKCLNFLLTWFASMQPVANVTFHVGVTALVVKCALELLESVMERVGIRSDEDLICIENVIKQLSA
jgi:hypothetical protein